MLFLRPNNLDFFKFQKCSFRSREKTKQIVRKNLCKQQIIASNIITSTQTLH